MVLMDVQSATSQVHAQKRRTKHEEQRRVAIDDEIIESSTVIDEKAVHLKRLYGGQSTDWSARCAQ